MRFLKLGSFHQTTPPGPIRGYLEPFFNFSNFSPNNSSFKTIPRLPGHRELRITGVPDAGESRIPGVWETRESRIPGVWETRESRISGVRDTGESRIYGVSDTGESF